MSYEVAIVPAPPAKARVLPPEVNNFVAAFWLAIGFGALVLLVLWPAASGFLPGAFNTIILAAILIGLVAVGAWVSRGITLGNQGALRVGKLVLLVGLAVGLVGVIGFFVAKVSGAAPQTGSGLTPPGFFGASPLLAGSLFGFLCLLPLLFAMLAYFMAMRDEVEVYFNPPAEDERTAFSRPKVVRREELEGLLEETPAVAEEELLAAEMQAEEASAAEASGLESTGEGLSDSDKAAYDDHEAPLSMGDLMLDDDAPTEKKD